MTNGRRVLVTGASGFVGRALVELLAADGFAVTAASRRHTEFSPGVRVVRIPDIGADTDWGSSLAGCDVVVHLAARVHQMKEAPAGALAAYRNVNAAGTVRLARAAAAAHAGRFVFISSVKVNGDSTDGRGPYTEADLPAPADAYGVSKLEAEEELFRMAAEGEFECTVIRPPLVYGPGVRANFLAMSRWLARGLPLPFGYVTENRRSLIGLDNLLSLIRVCVEHPRAANEVFLAADGEDLSTADLLRRTARALGVSPRLLPVPPPIFRAAAALAGRGDLVQRLCGDLRVDAGKARRLLGWQPPVGVDEGLRRAVQPLAR